MSTVQRWLISCLATSMIVVACARDVKDKENAPAARRTPAQPVERTAPWATLSGNVFEVALPVERRNLWHWGRKNPQRGHWDATLQVFVPPSPEFMFEVWYTFGNGKRIEFDLPFTEDGDSNVPDLGPVDSGSFDALVTRLGKPGGSGFSDGAGLNFADLSARPFKDSVIIIRVVSLGLANGLKAGRDSSVHMRGWFDFAADTVSFDVPLQILDPAPLAPSSSSKASGATPSAQYLGVFAGQEITNGRPSSQDRLIIEPRRITWIQSLPGIPTGRCVADFEATPSSPPHLVNWKWRCTDAPPAISNELSYDSSQNAWILRDGEGRFAATATLKRVGDVSSDVPSSSSAPAASLATKLAGSYRVDQSGDLLNIFANGTGRISGPMVNQAFGWSELSPGFVIVNVQDQLTGRTAECGNITLDTAD